VLAVLADGGGVAPQLSSFWCRTQRSESVRGRGDDDDARFDFLKISNRDESQW